MRRNITLFVLVCSVFLSCVSAVSAQPSLESYCKDGYYQIPGEKKCSRAPKCGGKTYDDMNKAEFMPNNNDCLDEGHGMIVGDPPNTSAFYGYVPLCCYEMVRLKDPEMCIGYWERLWCHPDQCAQIDNVHGCGGGGCNCGHAMKGWCEIRKCNMLPPVPIEVRLGMQKPTPTSAPSPTLPPFVPPTQPPVPTTFLPSAIPTMQPLIPTQIVIPPPTAVPFTIATTSPQRPSPALSPTPGFSFVLPQQIRSGMRAVVVQADRGFRAAGAAAYAVHQADSSLETNINLFFAQILSYIGNLLHK